MILIQTTENKVASLRIHNVTLGQVQVCRLEESSDDLLVGCVLEILLPFPVSST
jgi:hypothetical protein